MSTFLPPIGSRLWINLSGFRHYGILVDSGGVIHCSKKLGRVAISSIAEFSEGIAVKWKTPDPESPIQIIIERASSLVGEPYALFSNNCEHFVNFVQKESKTSYQIIGGVIGAAGGALIAARLGRSWKQSLLFAAAGLGVGIILANASQD